MYRYEELTLDDLLEDPTFDEESPDALYALAQCYRLGKGVQPDEEVCLKYLRKARDAGSEAARQELEAREGRPAADEKAEGRDPCLEDADRCRAAGDTAGEIAALERARNALSRYTTQDKQAIHLRHF